MEDGSNANFGEVTPMEAWNSDFMKNVRNTMLAGEIPASCTGCFDEEAQGIVSKRIWETATWLNDEGVDAEELIASNSMKMVQFLNNLQYLDLRLGHTCNIKCVMCSPHDSSKWVADWKKLVPQLEDESVKRQMHLGQKRI